MNSFLKHFFQKSGLWRPKGTQSECGERLVPSNIVGGRETKYGDFPYMALLGYYKSYLGRKENTYYECGGSLINRWYVLTAAHCVMDDDGNLKTPS